LRRNPLRALAAAAATLLAAACAHVEAPTGGPVDSIAPTLISTRPDTNAVLNGWTGPAVFVFSEGLSEQGVDEAVTLSPRRGPVAVDKEGDEIRVQPRRGWQPNTIYQVEIAPGLKDRFNNAVRTPSRLVFSTGPAIPDTRATGVVTDRVTGSPSVQARVDATRLADSLVYSTTADSAGRYTFRQVPEGEYRVIGYRDANRNFRVDAFEQRDTAVVTIAAGQTPVADLALLPNDTTGPVAGSARMTSGWIEIRFDDYLDPDQAVSPEQVSVVGPDGACVAISEVRIGPPPEARDTADEAEADSARPAAGQPPAGRPGAVQPGARPAADTAGADTTPPRGPLPSQALFARPAAELLPDTLYTVRVRDVRNVNGLVGGGEVPLRTPRPPPPARADSAAAPPDSAAPAVPPPVPADSAAPAPAAPPTAPPTTPPPGTPDRRADARAPVVPRGREQGIRRGQGRPPPVLGVAPETCSPKKFA
jgi:Carboxypeptidase regulatory-like domain/Bacterial Ig-like domain